jgi:hypothetical protein
MAPINYARYYGLGADYPIVPVPVSLAPSSSHRAAGNRRALGSDPTAPFGSGFVPRRPIGELLGAKSQGVLYLSSQCDTESDRDDFVRRAMKFMDIDSIGKCAHNKDWPVRLADAEFDADGTSLRQKWGAYDHSTGLLTATYKFRLVILSSIFDDYIAEKIRQTLVVGTIPIYLGMPNAHMWDPGLVAGVHPAIIHVTDFVSMAELADHLRDLSLDTEAARSKRARYFEYLEKLPIPTYPQHAAKIKAKWSGENKWLEFICHRTHTGDPNHLATAQGPTRGDWKHYFSSLGKDLTQWGVPGE